MALRDAIFLVVAALLLVPALFAQSGAGGNPEPLWLDFDMESVPEPKARDAGYMYDFAYGTFFLQLRQALDFPRHVRRARGAPKEASNVNSVDEVPDSSWFTNRNGMRRLSVEDLKRGPDETAGPAPGSYVVLRGKSEGITPGFWIKDSRGDTYILKFDPRTNPEMATGAEVISTKLFHAIGYNVPQNTIFHFRRDQLEIDPKATITDQLNRKRKFLASDLDAILERVAGPVEGRYRAVASKLLKGKPKGGFHFEGIRSDDRNDIIPHEDRRELRGLRIFAAWLAHNDIRVGNTLDLYVEEGGRKFLRHYLIDFGSTLGSDTEFANDVIVGHEHQMDFRQAGKVLATGGIYQPRWELRPEPEQFPSVGRLSSEGFHPLRWKQNFPLAAFDNMTEADARWAARIVSSFSDDQLRAAVECGELSDPRAAEYLVRQLMVRRDIIRKELFDRSYLESSISDNRVKP
ncbi:MAG TPA: hypothetical protein VEG32_04230 [Clostridia bacterium]|nr:hypothetical protein [Clostridia bacterium]